MVIRSFLNFPQKSAAKLEEKRETGRVGSDTGVGVMVDVRGVVGYYLLISVEAMQKEAEKPFEKHHTMKEKVEGLRYCRSIREFLQSYKTKKCTIQQEHNEQLCPHFHSPNDRRRNPYTNHTFAYYPTTPCTCGHEKCTSCHSLLERNFHPLAYKLQKCNNYYECPFQFQCPQLHAEDEPHFELGEYFRFDINLFKTKPCTRKGIIEIHAEPHQRKVCLYYHNQKDRRRGNFEAYSHIPCPKQNCACNKSHNKIEQLYHPSRYKSKFCQTYGADTLACEYRDFCSFAHTREEITIELIDENNKDPNYLIYNYKTVWCPYTLDHDRGNCPYAHNIQDYRRNPRDYKYAPEKCQAWNFGLKIESIEEGGCKAGMGCGRCHGWMEHRYHPLLYPAKRGKHYSARHDPFEKKVAYNHKRPSKKDKNIETIAHKNIETIAHKEVIAQKESEPKAAKFAVGAPFFKSERDKSSASKKTNTKTGNVGSEKTGNVASDKSCNQDEKESRHEVGSQLAGKSPPPLESDIWHFEEDEGKIQTRSKSQGNSSDFVPSYSHTIKDVFRNDNGLMDKLVKWKVNEITLINADEKKIDNMSFLNSKEKERLVNKLKQYSLKKDIGFIEYSQPLTRFFVRNHADHILQKLRNKKVNEPKIMKLQSRQATKDCSFLEEYQKELLPKLLKKYQQEVEFGSIMHSVERYIGDPTDDSYFNDDK